ncbi:MAG: serine/threonine protein kinase [Deltaproteobacteria bacterium]|nr:serine/threonine protein kinase [Deltaproteobacteria bacterium]
MTCPACNGDVLEIDVKCSHCGAPLGATGAHRMLGQVMLGQYELVDILGQGGMSVVFKGKHKLTEQEVALKILPPELAAHSQVKSRFLEEAKALAALDHPNIVHLYNFGQENGFFVLAMQYVQGRTWERIILENKRMDWRSSCKVAIEVLRALEYAHGRGVIHRDMKPSNVLVRAHDAMATVMDFGIAKMTTSTKLTATGQTMGTVRYMSPEQVRGQEVDLRTDLYSLGATLYESLTGDTPFDGSTHFEIMTKHLSEAPKRPSTLGIEVPKIVEDALMRSLAKKPADRFADAREMRKLLESALRLEGDGAIVDTQSLNREVLGEGRSAVPAKVATATAGVSLADELEPGTHTRAARKRSSLPWIAVGALVVAGGVAAAVVVLKRGGDGGPKATIQMKGVALSAEARIGAQLVATTGTIPPAELARHYDEALARYRAAARGSEPPLEIPDPVQELVAVPRAALCKPPDESRSKYLDATITHDCATATFATMIGPGGKRRLLVIDDPPLIPAAMARGVAYSVCLFAPMDEAGAEQQLRAICGLSKLHVSDAAVD